MASIFLYKRKGLINHTHDPKDREYQDKLYEDWWEKAEAFGIVEDGKLLAAIEVNPEEWSNRLLITELFVDKRIRGNSNIILSIKYFIVGFLFCLFKYFTK